MGGRAQEGGRVGVQIPTKSKPYDPEMDPTYERISRLLGETLMPPLT
jgi:hypothetical protein